MPPRALKDRAKHRLSEFAGRGVLLARMVGTDQQRLALARVMLRIIAETMLRIVQRTRTRVSPLDLARSRRIP